jgi:hypothetical protein
VHNQDKVQKLSFLKFMDKNDVSLCEISIIEAEPNSWNIDVRTFTHGTETANEQSTFLGELNKTNGLSEILENFKSEDGWFEYKPGRFVGNLKLMINENHTDFVEISILDDDSAKSNIEIKTITGGNETLRQVLTFANDSKREAANLDLRQKYSHENGWFLYSKSHGWDSLPKNSPVPLITAYVRLAGKFEDDYEFLEVSNRNEAKNRAEIEFADYSVVDRIDNQIHTFEQIETKTKSLKNADGSTYIQAFVEAWWWSAYYPVEAVCVDEAEQLFLRKYSNRFSVIGAWDPDVFIEFTELRPQGTMTVQQSGLPSNLAIVLEEIEKQGHTSAELSIADLEWIFFGAMGRQLQELGGTLPAIDYGASGTEFYQKWGRPNFGTEEEIYWPPNQVLTKSEKAYLLDLFLRYRLLWEGDPVYEDFLSLHIGVHFEIESLNIQALRAVLAQKLESQNWGALSFLAGETRRLLSDVPVFAS